MKYYILTFFAIVLFFALGMIIYDPFLTFSLERFNEFNIVYQYRDLSGQFTKQVLFAISLGSIPILFFLVDKFTNKTIRYKGLVIFSFIILSGILAWFWRLEYLRNSFKKYSIYNSNNIQNTFYFNELRFNEYLLLGFIIGAIVSLIVLRARSKN